MGIGTTCASSEILNKTDTTADDGLAVSRKPDKVVGSAVHRGDIVHGVPVAVAFQQHVRPCNGLHEAARNSRSSGSID